MLIREIKMKNYKLLLLALMGINLVACNSGGTAHPVANTTTNQAHHSLNSGAGIFYNMGWYVTVVNNSDESYTVTGGHTNKDWNSYDLNKRNVIPPHQVLILYTEASQEDGYQDVSITPTLSNTTGTAEVTLNEKNDGKGDYVINNNTHEVGYAYYNYHTGGNSPFEEKTSIERILSATAFGPYTFAVASVMYDTGVTDVRTDQSIFAAITIQPDGNIKPGYLYNLPVGSYMSSCQGMSVSADGTQLMGQCYNKDKKSVPTQLNLSNHRQGTDIYNDNGALKCSNLQGTIHAMSVQTSYTESPIFYLATEESGLLKCNNVITNSNCITINRDLHPIDLSFVDNNGYVITGDNNLYFYQNDKFVKTLHHFDKMPTSIDYTGNSIYVTTLGNTLEKCNLNGDCSTIDSSFGNGNILGGSPIGVSFNTSGIGFVVTRDNHLNVYQNDQLTNTVTLAGMKSLDSVHYYEKQDFIYLSGVGTDSQRKVLKCTLSDVRGRTSKDPLQCQTIGIYNNDDNAQVHGIANINKDIYAIANNEVVTLHDEYFNGSENECNGHLIYNSFGSICVPYN